MPFIAGACHSSCFMDPEKYLWARFSVSASAMSGLTSSQVQLISACTISLAFSSTFVLLRLIVRRTTVAGFWYDDWACVLALVWLLFVSIDNMELTASSWFLSSRTYVVYLVGTQNLRVTFHCSCSPGIRYGLGQHLPEVPKSNYYAFYLVSQSRFSTPIRTFFSTNRKRAFGSSRSLGLCRSLSWSSPCCFPTSGSFPRRGFAT